MKFPVKPRDKEIDIKKYTFVLYGQPKIGKTTFASQFENAIFLATESGHRFVNCQQFCNDAGEPMTIKTWKEFKDAVRMLLTVPHDFKTCVIDVTENAADQCTREVIATHGVVHEQDLAYGKGSALIKREFKTVIDALLASGMGVVFICHSKTSEIEERGVKINYTDVSLANAFKNYVLGCSDFILYAFRDSNGKRMLRTKASSSVNAGDRSGLLPEIMPFDYNLMVKTLNSATEKVE